MTTRLRAFDCLYSVPTEEDVKMRKKITPSACIMFLKVTLSTEPEKESRHPAADRFPRTPRPQITRYNERVPFLERRTLFLRVLTMNRTRDAAWRRPVRQ